MFCSTFVFFSTFSEDDEGAEGDEEYLMKHLICSINQSFTVCVNLNRLVFTLPPPQGSSLECLED